VRAAGAHVRRSTRAVGERADTAAARYAAATDHGVAVIVGVSVPEWADEACRAVWAEALATLKPAQVREPAAVAPLLFGSERRRRRVGTWLRAWWGAGLRPMLVLVDQGAATREGALARCGDLLWEHMTPGPTGHPDLAQLEAVVAPSADPLERVLGDAATVARGRVVAAGLNEDPLLQVARLLAVAVRDTLDVTLTREWRTSAPRPEAFDGTAWGWGPYLFGNGPRNRVARDRRCAIPPLIVPGPTASQLAAVLRAWHVPVLPAARRRRPTKEPTEWEIARQKEEDAIRAEWVATRRALRIEEARAAARRDAERAGKSEQEIAEAEQQAERAFTAPRDPAQLELCFSRRRRGAHPRQLRQA
jgi:hypothetical protein